MVDSRPSQTERPFNANLLPLCGNTEAWSRTASTREDGRKSRDLLKLDKSKRSARSYRSYRGYRLLCSRCFIKHSLGILLKWTLITVVAFVLLGLLAR
jgi:hypothetical protein